MKPKPCILKKERKAAIALMKDVRDIIHEASDFLEIYKDTDIADLDCFDEIKIHIGYLYELETHLGDIVGYTIQSDILNGEEITLP